MTPEREACLRRLANLILAVDRPHPVRVAIDGTDAAGKTILADELAPLVAVSGRAVVRASVDGFHRPRAQRLARGSESPEGYYHDSFDYPVLREVLLDPLGPAGDRTIRRRVFDVRADEAVDCPSEQVPVDAILLFDGVFLLRRELRDVWDFAVFVAVPFDETVRRAARRDLEALGSGEAVRHRYAVRYVPGQKLYFEAEGPERAADVVVENGDPGCPLLRRRGAPDASQFQVDGPA